MSFQREMGALIAPNGQVLKLITGQPALVHFPFELAKRLHNLKPGIVHLLMHTHPPGMSCLSSVDESTLKAWAMAMSPFPVRMGVITKSCITTAESIEDNYDYEPYIVRVFFGDLESKEEWIARGRKGSRKFRILEEEVKGDDLYWRHRYADQLWGMSCEEENCEKI